MAVATSVVEIARDVGQREERVVVTATVASPGDHLLISSLNLKGATYAAAHVEASGVDGEARVGTGANDDRVFLNIAGDLRICVWAPSNSSQGGD